MQLAEPTTAARIGRSLTTLALLAALVALLAWTAATARADVVTYSNDALRTGWYPDQPSLSPATVTGGSFGQLFSRTVNGQVYAQPVVAANTLFVATESNSIYGLDPESGALRWSRNLGAPWNPQDLACST